jgi:hypothetical protein
MKKMVLMITLWGLAALILGGCAVPLGEDFTIPRDTDERGVYVVDYDLQTYVPIPVAGEPAVKLVTQRGDLEATVTWKDAAGAELPLLGTFAADTVYKAEIRLTPREGYLFNSSINFAYHPGKIDVQNDDQGGHTRTVTVVYNNSNDGNITYITDYNLQSYVPFPIAGQHPVWTVATEGVTGTVSWNRQGEPPVPLEEDEVFAAGTTYTADISLEVVPPDYRFRPTRNFAYAADTVERQPDANPHLTNRVLSTVIYSTPKTPVTLFDLTSYITTPEEGIAPSTTAFTNEQYTATGITWNPDHAAFKRTSDYTAVVVLAAAPGFAFPVKPGFFHEDATSVTIRGNTGDSVTVDILFRADTVKVVVQAEY